MKKRLLVLYKSHLDIGFTDMAQNVVQLYLTQFIPNAVDTALQLNQNGKRRFVWLTGSWILNEYLNSVSGEALRRVEYAIEKEYITWHALPFTAHTELYTPELLEYAIEISRNLDKKYGKCTIAVKDTDVPGMTQAMIKPLVRAGVRFLHVGVNPASPLPNVPTAFRWQNQDGEELMVMYNEDYGEYAQISEECSVTFFFAGDNRAPMRAEEIEAKLDALQQENPDVELIPATLNDLAMEMEKVKDTLPVVRGEIGDSWVHGVMSDPRKVSTYLSLMDYAKQVDESTRRKMYRHLLLIPEHTWGLAEKVNLCNTTHYAKEDFEEIRQTPPFQRIEASWQEQRGYTEKAAEAANDERTLDCLSEYRREWLCPMERHKLLPENIRINTHGEIVYLKLGNRILADEQHPLCSFLYEQFSEDEYNRFFLQYNRMARKGLPAKPWMVDDFTKTGMAMGIDTYRSYRPDVTDISFDGEYIFVDCVMPREAGERFGCPREIQYKLCLTHDRLAIDFAWFHKDKNRMAEAMWLVFSPVVMQKMEWRIEKLGQMIDPFRYVGGGGVQHFTSGIVQNEDVTLRFPDGGLISFGRPNLLNFDDTLITGECLSVNLYNNLWGTNFPAWYDDDGRVRIELSVTDDNS